jgi:hypothetical protein
VSGVELLGLLLLGVVVEDGLVVLLGLEEFMSELLDGEVELGELEVLLLELDGEVEFMSVLLLEPDGEVVEDGELEVLESLWLDDVDGLL